MHASPIYSFEFRGIASGMTTEQTRKHLRLPHDLEGVFVGAHGQQGVPVSRIKHLFHNEPSLDRLVFYFTDKGELWRLDLKFIKPHDPLEHAALRAAIEETFTYAQVKETFDNFVSYYVISLVEQSLADAAIKRYRDNFLHSK